MHLAKIQKKLKFFAKFKNLIKLYKCQNISSNIKARKFLISKAKMIFFHLRQLFIKASIFWYCHIKYYINIEINVLIYIIDSILSPLTIFYVIFDQITLNLKILPNF